MESSTKIAVLGGTGALGYGLATRFAKAGLQVCIGSRDPNRAVDKANALRAVVPDAEISASTYREAARDNDIVVLAVPFASHDETLELIADALHGKILIDVTAPVKPPKVFVVQLPGGRSVAEATQERLGNAVRVVSAFQNVAAAKLIDEGDVACDVLVSGDDVEARKIVMALVRSIGLRPINAGPIANAIAAEALTAVLIGVNKWHKADHAGICITGLA